MSVIIGAIVLIILSAGFLAVAYLINGWALRYLWEWFIVPLGFPALSLPWAIGVGIVIAFLTNHTVPKKSDKDDTDANKTMIYLIVRPLLAVLIGWIVKGFM